MTSNFLDTGVDLDYTYVLNSDPNFSNLNALNISNRRVVIFGQNLLTNVYPLGNFGLPFSWPKVGGALNTPKVDIDNNIDVIKTLPTAILFANRSNTSQTLIRGQFSLLENTPQDSATLNQASDTFTPIQITGFSIWLDVRMTNAGAIGLKTDNSLWTWGYNILGTLGTNNTTTFSSPVQIFPREVGLDGWKSISATNNHTLAIRTDGTLWTWGSNAQNQLGIIDTNSRSSAVRIGFDSDWARVFTTDFSSFAIKSNGTLWAWGYNNNGQLGFGDQVQRTTPVQLGTNLWKEVAETNGNFTGMIRTDGTLWMVGANFDGQLGDAGATRSSPTQLGTNLWKKIIGGNNYSVAIRSDGTLWAWGNNSFGQLGQSNLTHRSSPVQIGSNLWKEVSAMNSRTFAIRTDGTLWGWGNNQLTTGVSAFVTSDTTRRLSPVQIGTESYWVKVSCGSNSVMAAIQSGGILWVWGLGTNGNLGRNNLFLTSEKVPLGI